jgi:hypothetical protein
MSESIEMAMDSCPAAGRLRIGRRFAAGQACRLAKS